MQVDAATTSEDIGQLRQALEAEARTAVAAYHFVALSFLRSLVGKVLLRHGHITFRTLLRTGFLHPLLQALRPIVRFLAPFALLLHCVLLTCEALMVRLRIASNTRGFPAHRTPETSDIVFWIQGNAHWAIRRGTRPQVRCHRDRTLQASGQEAVNHFIWHHAPQVAL